jgi:hypothetical protein
MSRSGYDCDIEQWDLICWRGQVAAAIRGKRGQAFLLEMWRAMQTLPTHELTTGKLDEGANVCALGAVGRKRGIDMQQVDPNDNENVATLFGIPLALACEIMWENDEGGGGWRYETKRQRFERVKKWIESHLLPVDA